MTPTQVNDPNIGRIKERSVSMMRLRSIRRLFSLSSQVRRRRALGFDLEVPEEPRISLRGYPAQQRSGKGGNVRVDHRYAYA